MTATELLHSWKARVDETLDRLLPAADGPARTIAEAMRYAVQGGGKRLRPQLAVAACDACGGDPETVLAPAAALEMIHTYSLIHDDLPAMDDDDLRRGRPTLHRRYSEAVAILAGDALHTLAFEILATHPRGDALAARRSAASELVARASGIDGMVGGQIADLEAEGGLAGADTLDWIHRHKTGALFTASVELGAIHSGASVERTQALREFGRSLGLAFQIADDLLDRTSTAAELGKTPGKDERSGKSTYPALFGMEPSRQRAVALLDESVAVLRREDLLTEPILAVTDAVRARCR